MMLMKTKTIWETYSKDVKQFIMSKVHDEALADDLLQETFIKVHTKLETLDDPNKVKPWVFSIARHVVMDYFRTIKKELPELDSPVIAEDSHLEHSHSDCLQGIIKSLPEKYKVPLMLADIQGLKQTDISEKLNLPLATVKSQIQRGRKLVAQGFVKCCDFKINENGLLVGELQDKEHCKICT